MGVCFGTPDVWKTHVGDHLNPAFCGASGSLDMSLLKGLGFKVGLGSRVPKNCGSRSFGKLRQASPPILIRYMRHGV